MRNDEKMDLCRLLIADDEPIIRGGLKNVIKWEEIGFQVTGIFPCGKDLIRFLTDNPADVILTDISMENGTGLDVAEWVEKNAPSVKIILITGYTDYQAAQRAVSYSCVKHLINKPVCVPQMKSLFVQLYQEFCEERQRLSAQNVLHMECIRQILQGNDLSDKLWSSLSLRCVVLQVPENRSARTAPVLHSERINFDYFGIVRQKNEYTLFLYPCSEKQIGDLEETASTYLLQRADPSDMEVYTFAQKQKLLAFLSEGRSQNETAVPEMKREIDRYIQTHLSEKLTLNDAAEYMHYSPCHFSRKFKLLTGCSFTAYMMDMRIETAKKLLKETERSISAIAAATGFENAHYFSYVFKQKERATPSAYRRSILNQEQRQ